ncbi:PREDICTED: basic 7S globulin-like [Nelumbo nucifera]|uniref:Basic 7S globulin-like n=1 Tax=Nelumbo nucifera TaxID=4432 RepID=A0A1U8BAF4_NELNU|nr:PREDICTED: basic 7S globulin-like [Nelumbo nucifera]
MSQNQNSPILTKLKNIKDSHHPYPFSSMDWIWSQRFHLLSFSLLTFLIALSDAQKQKPFRPHSFILPITKDAPTLQYVTQIRQRTPFVTVDLVVDLGGQFLWVDCESAYFSSSYHPVPCNSSQCSATGANGCGQCLLPASPGCSNNTCVLFPGNTVTKTTTSGELTEDMIAVRSTDGSSPATRIVSVPRFLFTCSARFLLERLAGGVKGMAGLGRGPIGMPSQLAAAFSFPRKFAVCLPSSANVTGVIFFGDVPHNLLPEVEVSRILSYTPLITNPVSAASTFTKGEPSVEYFIGVKSIEINKKPVLLNSDLLSIDGEGVGGTKISTVVPYTTLETSIYNSVTGAFMEEAISMGITRVGAVAPFGACFSSESIRGSRMGAEVPSIDLVLQGQSVWRIFGKNAMVDVREGVLCLGFLDGGRNPRTSIVLGGHQLEDILLQFDLKTSKLGFSPLLHYRQTSCANFIFTTTAS